MRLTQKHHTASGRLQEPLPPELFRLLQRFRQTLRAYPPRTNTTNTQLCSHCLYILCSTENETKRAEGKWQTADRQIELLFLLRGMEKVSLGVWELLCLVLSTCPVMPLFLQLLCPIPQEEGKSSKAPSTLLVYCQRCFATLKCLPRSSSIQSPVKGKAKMYFAICLCCSPFPRHCI